MKEKNENKNPVITVAAVSRGTRGNIRVLSDSTQVWKNPPLKSNFHYTVQYLLRLLWLVTSLPEQCVSDAC